VVGVDRQLARTAGDGVGEVEVGEADQRAVGLAGEQVRGVGVAAVAQVQQDVLRERSGVVGLGDGRHERLHVGDLRL